MPTHFEKHPPSPGFSGHHTEWSGDKKKKWEGHYKDGKRTGVWRLWHKNPKKIGREWKRIIKLKYLDGDLDLSGQDFFIYSPRG
jgi:hypothetical protein